MVVSTGGDTLASPPEVTEQFFARWRVKLLLAALLLVLLGVVWAFVGSAAVHQAIFLENNQLGWEGENGPLSASEVETLALSNADHETPTDWRLLLPIWVFVGAGLALATATATLPRSPKARQSRSARLCAAGVGATVLGGVLLVLGASAPDANGWGHLFGGYANNVWVPVLVLGTLLLGVGAAIIARRRLGLVSADASLSSVDSSLGAPRDDVTHDLSSVPQRSVLRAALAGIGTLLFLIGGGLAIAGIFVGNGGNPLFYWAYTGFAGRIPQLVAFFVGLVLALAGIALWIAAGLSPNANQRAERAAVASESERARSVAAQAEQIKRWEEAYALAHNGESPPPGATPPMIANTGSSRTNTLSILALVFGVLGSVLGIVFGHVALSQIKRTGEAGRGLAIAGLVVGYLQLGVGVLILIIAGILAAVQR